MRTRLRARLAEQERSRHRTDDELRELRAELRIYRDAFDVLPIGVVATDRSGRELLRNRRGASPTSDLQADAIVSTAVQSLVASASAASADDHGPWHQTVELLGPPPRSVEVSVHRLSGGGVVAVTEDASDRRRVDALRRDFVDNVNHELRTPVGALAVLVEALEGESDPSVVRRLTGRMACEVQRARALIEALLQLSSIERAEPPQSVPVEMVGVVESAVHRTEAAAGRAGVRLNVSLPMASPVASGDYEELISAVTNLIDNAIKYSDRGGEIEVALEARGASVELVVRDHGVGIPSKDLDRIFERFYRVDRARDRRTGGTGLGLAIVRNVAVKHGGEVSVRSVEGEGSAFTLRLRSWT